MLNNRRRRRAGPPVACPVCSCERFDQDRNGVNCVCHSCGTVYVPETLRRIGGETFRQLAAPLTGAADQLEPGDVLTYLEDPDVRPYLWDL